MAEFYRGDFSVSTDKTKLQLDVIHRFLSEESYWSKGIPREVVEKSIEHSLCFGLYDETNEEHPQQIGFARLVTDRATFAYLADVFVLPSYRGRGLSKWLMECIVGLPELQGLRRWMLGTRDAHSLYAQFGFAPLGNPERFMHRHNPDVYQSSLS